MSNNDPRTVLDTPNTCVILSSDLEEMVREIRRLTALVEAAYNEGWMDAIGEPEDTQEHCGSGWRKSDSRKLLPHATGCGE